MALKIKFQDDTVEFNVPCIINQDTEEELFEYNPIPIDELTKFYDGEKIIETKTHNDITDKADIEVFNYLLWRDNKRSLQ